MQKKSFLLSQIFLCIFSCLSTTATQAQITPDNTLNTQVESNGNVSEITGGQTQGDNLFHSFQDFSVQNGTEAFFNNVAEISNIFSRVTGSNISNIDGLIRNNDSANLFFINPNGIIFGEGAQLNIGGSFLASTASSILFNEGEFSTANTENTPLLTIDSPIGLGLADNPAEIVNRSTVQNSEGVAVGLEVLPGNNISLVGGDLKFEGGKATASGGNVELGGLSTVGTIAISENGSLNFPEDVAQADVNLSNGAVVDVTGMGAGNIAVNARNLDMTGLSLLDAGINQGSTSNNTQAGDITIDISDRLTLNRSRIRNLVNGGGVGNSGSINISTDSLTATNGGRISSSTFIGQGNAGGIDIDATGDITFEGSEVRNNIVDPSGAFSLVVARAEGNGGDINISAANLTLKDGGEVNASTGSQGNGGNINLTASDSISINTGTIDGDTLNPSDSRNGVLTRVGSGAAGNAGDVAIDTNNLQLTNGATIGTATNGQGNAGSINVNAVDITFEGVNTRSQPSSIGSRVERQGVGNGGNVNITAENFNLTNGGQINAGIVGQGNGGDVNLTVTKDLNITSGNFPTGIFSVINPGGLGKAGNLSISTGNLTLSNGGLIDVSTSGQGNAGLVEIIASDAILIDGETLDGSNSSISSGVKPGGVGNARGVKLSTGNLTLSNGGMIDANTGGVGNAGGVTIDADNLTLFNQGQVTASTSSQGDAGLIEIIANDTIFIDGESSSQLSSRISSRVNSGAIGDARGVTITTDNLTLTNGGYLDASIFGQGNAGSIDITAKDITFEGTKTLDNFPSSAFSQVNPGGEGNAGGVTINTDNLTLRNGGLVSVDSLDRGNAGNVNVFTNQLTMTNGGRINAVTQSGTGVSGLINLEVAENVILQDNSLISAEALENANGGSVTIDASLIIADPNSNSDILASAEQGQGGNITINVKSLFGIEERPVNDSTNDINASSEFNSSGTVEINILETDPSQNSLDIPVEPVKAEVSQTCERNISGNQSQSEFVVTGRGGLPTEPEDNFRLGAIARNKVAEPIANTENGLKSETSAQQQPESQPIVEATGWMRNVEGKIVLLASSPTGSSFNSQSNSANCNL